MSRQSKHPRTYPEAVIVGRGALRWSGLPLGEGQPLAFVPVATSPAGRPCSIAVALAVVGTAGRFWQCVRSSSAWGLGDSRGRLHALRLDVDRSMRVEQATKQ